MTTADLRQAARAFAQAVDLTARGSGDAHERLVLAWKRYLVALRPETLPSLVRAVPVPPQSDLRPAAGW
jgi:hypothetical protein